MVRRNKALSHSSKAKHGQIITIAVVAAIILYALIYSLLRVAGASYYGDDLIYANLAYSMSHPGLSPNAYLFWDSPLQEQAFIFSVRPLHLYPIAFFYYLFGVSLLSSAAWDIISFIGSVFVVFLIGKELHNAATGALAALLLAFFPIAVMLESTMSVNMPMMLFNALAVLALIRAVKLRSRAWYLLLPVFCVASFLVTPIGVITPFAIVLYLLVALARGTPRIGREGVFFIFGLLAALAAMFAFYYMSAGDPLIAITTNAHFYGAIGQSNTIPFTNNNPMYYVNTMFPFLFARQDGPAPSNLLLVPFQIRNNFSGLYFYAFVAASAYLAYRRRGYAALPLFWFVFGFLYLEFGPMHIALMPFSYLPMYRLQRFLTVVALPLVLIIAMALSDLFEAARREQGTVLRLLAFAIPVLALTALLFNAYLINSWWYEGFTVFDRYFQLSIAGYLNTLPSNTHIYVSSASPMLEVYAGYYNASRFYLFDNITDCHLIPAGAYVVVPEYPFSDINYTPDPQLQCPSWELVMDPKVPQITDPTVLKDIGAMARLYRVPG